MAMLRVGKLVFRFKDGGVDYIWGDGEKRRIELGKKRGDSGETGAYPDDYVEGSDTSGLGYDGRFADSDGGYADEYAEDGYDDQYDDGYDDQYGDGYQDDYEDGQYEDDGYYDDAGYQDDGYDDGYYDEEGYDGYEEGEYDDRYSDTDADESYGDGGYSTYPENSILQYVDENDWVTYLLLVLLPPLGIYLLWRRQCFEKPVRYGISAASAVWFVVAIILLAMNIFGGTGDESQMGNPSLPSASPTVSASASPSPSPSPSATAQSGIAPTSTPIGGGQASATNGTLVYASATGTFYHQTNTCNLIEAGETVTQVTVDNAKGRGKYACPQCYDGVVYYATVNGKWYHLDSKCTDMVGATPYSKEMGEAENKTACPVCVTKTQTSLYDTSNVVFITTSTTDKSGVEVWCTPDGKWYHLTSNCRGMQGATKGKLRDALLMGKTACPTCCAASGTLVYCTKGGSFFHANATCSNMKNAKQVTLAEAMVLGKPQCTTCMPNVTSAGGSNQESGTYYVYARSDGDYYHINSTCSGMKNATRVPLSSMLELGRPACPECCSGADMTVYAAQGGTYYHSYATCSNMTNAVQGTLANALAMGYQRCTKCWGDNTTVGDASSGAGTATADTVMVYATQGGRNYHTNSTCTGMENASRISLRVAIAAGKTACSNCAAAAQTLVYSTDTGKHYHQDPDCSNMKNAKQKTLAEALLLNQTMCDVCYVQSGEGAGETTTLEKVADYTVGTSGIKVYAAPSEAYFHTKSNCSGKTGMEQMALEIALNYGKDACPTCASGAAETVYATPNGRYYHISRSCAGDGAAAGPLADALALGFTGCPYCVTGTQTAPTQNGNFVIGTSGVKVYATVDGTYYHADKSCAGSNAAQISLETALNYGKRACQTCCSIAERTVYAVAGSMTYHSNKSCAGSNAVAGTFAQALAYGMSACPNCVGSGSTILPGEGAEYNAPESTVVYVDLDSDQYYYHKASSCSGFGMSGGTAQTLEFAKDFGYARCPYCNPASGIS